MTVRISKRHKGQNFIRIFKALTIVIDFNNAMGALMIKRKIIKKGRY